MTKKQDIPDDYYIYIYQIPGVSRAGYGHGRVYGWKRRGEKRSNVEVVDDGRLCIYFLNILYYTKNTKFIDYITLLPVCEVNV
jgi:hypothetical protein